MVKPSSNPSNHARCLPSSSSTCCPRTSPSQNQTLRFIKPLPAVQSAFTAPVNFPSIFIVNLRHATFIPPFPSASILLYKNSYPGQDAKVQTLEMNGEAGNSMMTPPPSSGMAGMKKHMGGGGMMHMTFFWGKRVQILFTGWPGDQGVGMYLLSLLCVLFVAALVELLSGVSRRVARPNASRITGFALTVLHAVRIGMSYLVMLAVMSFNVGVLIAAIVGHALGFLFTGSGLFKWSRPTVDPAGGDEIPSIKD